MKMSFADILRQVDSEGARKMASKVPEWQDVEGLSFPTKLCTEQCSSSETARYKAGVALREYGRISGVPDAGKKPYLADLTGGLGVDSWAFSQVCEEVFYNEMDEILASGVRSNFGKLSADNITVHSNELVPGSLETILCGFKPDIIFLDPARRSDSGKKVFMVEDCRPDILTLRDELLACAPLVIVKLSPMADISLLARQLGDHVLGIHVVGSAGECKELLVIMDRDHHESYDITVHESESDFHFTPEEEDASSARLCEADRLAGKMLFEPGKALMKAGAYNLICERHGLSKLGRSTHLYVSEEIVGSLTGLGKWYRIESTDELNKRSMKETGKSHPRCEVTARNIPMSSDELRKRMGTTSGGDKHVFGVKCDLSGSNLLMVTTRLGNIRP
ncbi:MAG: hypothetical protein KBT05_06725 [Bacteroidales bacterium]|nr:hypothetical protein [Candidatus Cryptobacteroides caccocaballi]